MKLNFCKAEAAHLPLCAEMARGSQIEAVYFPQRGAFAALLQTALEAGQLYLALSEEGRPAGLVKIVPKGFCGLYPYLSLICTAPAHQGQGVGRFLLNQFEEMAKRQGSAKTALLVSDFNESAKNLYLRHGYREIGLIPNAVKPGVGEYLLLKDLK